MLLGTSCKNEEIVSRTEGQEFSLTLDMGAKSRTMMGENGAVWGDNEALYVVGEGGKSYGTLTMVWKSEDGKSAMFSGKITGDAGKLEHMVYPVPNGENIISVKSLIGDNHNAPMVGRIVDGEVNGLGYGGGLVKLDFSTAAEDEDFTVKATNADGELIVGGYYQFDPVNGTLTYHEVEGSTLSIDNVPANGIVWLPVASDAPKGTPETITVSVTDKYGNTISGNVNISQGGAAAEDGNVFPSMTYDINTGLAPTESESVDGANVLEEAFTNGGQYLLTQDITLTKALSLPENKSLYLDLNGKTITLDGSNAEEVVEIENYGTLNIFNGKIVATDYENSRRCIYNYGTMTIGMEGGSQPVEFVQQYKMEGAAINNEGNMTIKNATVNAVYYSIWNSGKNAEIVVNSGTYTTENDVTVRDTWAYAVNNINGAKMTINGGSFTGNHGVVAATTGAEVTLNGGEFNCTAEYTGDSDWTLYTDTGGIIMYDYGCTLTHAKLDNRYAATYESKGSSIFVTVDSFTELQDAIDYAEAGKEDRIALAGDIEGTIVVTEKNNVHLEINGFENKYDGQIKIKGNSNGENGCSLLIKNVNFETSTAELEFIWSADSQNGSYWRYVENVTVEGCTFTALGDAIHTAVGAKFQQAYNIKLVGCIANNMHTLLQTESCGSMVSVEGCTVNNGKNGVSFNNTKDANISGTTIESVVKGGYGIRHKGQVDNYKLTVTNCDVEAFVPVLIRNMTAQNGYTATFSGENTLTETNPDYDYQIVISNGDYDGTENPVKPTGNYTLIGAEGFKVFGK